jgi:hypothetical protein
MDLKKYKNSLAFKEGHLDFNFNLKVLILKHCIKTKKNNSVKPIPKMPHQ